MAFCSMCGKSIVESAAFCPYCGSKTEIPVAPAAAVVTPTTFSAPVEPQVSRQAVSQEPDPIPDYIESRYPHLSRPKENYTAPVENDRSSYTQTGYSAYTPETQTGYTPYTPTGEYTPGSFSSAERPVGGYAPTGEYTPSGYTGYQPEVAEEAPPKKREMPWQSDPRAREAAEKASKAATQTVSGMMDAYKKALSIVVTKPIMLWGLSLLYNLLTTLAIIFSLLPIIWLPINLVLQLGVSSIYLAGIRGKKVNSDALFAGFKNFFKNAGGMGWRALWMIIWGIVVGILASIAAAAFAHGTYIMEMGKYLDFGVLKQIGAVIEIFLAAVALLIAVVIFIGKSYAYDFVPYILLSEEGVSGTEALCRSMKLAKGWKLKMFAADMAVILAYAIIVAIFAGLTNLTDGFFLFKILLVLVGLIGTLLGSLFFGLLHAAFYEMASGKEKK